MPKTPEICGRPGPSSENQNVLDKGKGKSDSPYKVGRGKERGGKGGKRKGTSVGCNTPFPAMEGKRTNAKEPRLGAREKDTLNDKPG